MRTPDEWRLGKIADFFGVTVEWLRRDNRTPPPPAPHAAAPLEPPLPYLGVESPPPGVGQAPPNMGASIGAIAGVDVPPSPSWEPAPPGSAASFFWLARHFVASIETHGLRLDRQSLDYLANILKR